MRVSLLQDGQSVADGILRISRSNLRKVLVSHMPSDIVRWGTACTSAVPAANAGGKIQLGFADGSTTECDGGRIKQQVADEPVAT